MGWDFIGLEIRRHIAIWDIALGWGRYPPRQEWGAYAMRAKAAAHAG